MDFDKQLFRASAMGLLLTNDRSGKDMGDTCKNYLNDLYIELKYGLKKDIKSKYIEKGLMAEDDAITFYSAYYDDFYHKNTERFNNEYVTGEPDIISNDLIIDIKTSWDASTFPFKFKKEPINKAYFYQLQCYMWLTGIKKAKIAYVLIDTPAQLVEDEKRRLSWQIGATSDLSPEFLEACAEIDKNHNFSQIPVADRISEYEVEYDEKVIEAMKQRVLKAREYLKSLDK